MDGSSRGGIFVASGSTQPPAGGAASDVVCDPTRDFSIDDLVAWIFRRGDVISKLDRASGAEREIPMLAIARSWIALENSVGAPCEALARQTARSARAQYIESCGCAPTAAQHAVSIARASLRILRASSFLPPSESPSGSEPSEADKPQDSCKCADHSPNAENAEERIISECYSDNLRTEADADRGKDDSGDFEKTAPKDGDDSIGAFLTGAKARQIMKYATQIAIGTLQWMKTHADAEALAYSAEKLQKTWSGGTPIDAAATCSAVHALQRYARSACSDDRTKRRGNAECAENSNNFASDKIKLPDDCELLMFWCLRLPIPDRLRSAAGYRTVCALMRRERGVANPWQEAAVSDRRRSVLIAPRDDGKPQSSENPPHADIFMRFCRAWAWLETDQPARAAEAIESDFSQGATHPALWLLLARAAIETGELGKADYALNMAKSDAPRAPFGISDSAAPIGMLPSVWAQIVGGYEARLGRAALDLHKARAGASGEAEASLIELAFMRGDSKTRADAAEYAFSSCVAASAGAANRERIGRIAQTLAGDGAAERLFLTSCARKAEEIVLRASQRYEENFNRRSVSEDYSDCKNNSEYHSDSSTKDVDRYDDVWIEKIYELHIAREAAGGSANTAESRIYRALTQIDAPDIAAQTIEAAVADADAGDPLLRQAQCLYIALCAASGTLDRCVSVLASALCAPHPGATLLLLKILSGLGRDAYPFAAQLLTQAAGAEQTAAMFMRLKSARDPYRTLSRQIAEKDAAASETAPPVSPEVLAQTVLPISLQAAYAARRLLNETPEEAQKRARRNDVLTARGLIEKDTARPAPAPGPWHHERAPKASDAFER